jgi:hypothetical protein
MTANLSPKPISVQVDKPSFITMLECFLVKKKNTTGLTTEEYGVLRGITSGTISEHTAKDFTQNHDLSNSS